MTIQPKIQFLTIRSLSIFHATYYLYFFDYHISFPPYLMGFCSFYFFLDLHFLLSWLFFCDVLSIFGHAWFPCPALSRQYYLFFLLSYLFFFYLMSSWSFLFFLHLHFFFRIDCLWCSLNFWNTFNAFFISIQQSLGSHRPMSHICG